MELALSYLRLDGGGTDYLIREYALDAILRQAARKYAPLFIRSRVSLELEETGLQVLTDEKWLQLVVEQVLSNAVKYAPGGHVKVWCEGERLLVRDDGVGIAPEDLPRVFDRGFTGCNGRLDKRATGIHPGRFAETPAAGEAQRRCHHTAAGADPAETAGCGVFIPPPAPAWSDQW